MMLMAILTVPGNTLAKNYRLRSWASCKPIKREVMKALLLSLGFALSINASADTITGHVVAIADGDTVTVLEANQVQHKIRLAGVDAPEKKQPFGDRSKQHLSDLVFNKPVTVEWNKLDRYGRTIGKVMVNGVDANLEQIKAGMAWWYEKYRKEQNPTDQQTYAAAEQEARAKRIGLWRDPEPMPPWEWRHR